MKFNRIRKYQDISGSLCITITTILIGLSVFANPAFSTIASGMEAENVCNNWLTQIVFEKGEWGESPAPEIAESHDIIFNDILLARCYSIHPKGFVIVPILKEMQPVKVYSDESNIDLSPENEFLLMIKEVLYDRIQLYEDIYGDIDNPQDVNDVELFDNDQRDLWEEYSQQAEKFNTGLVNKRLLSEAGPMLTSSWHQREPYNNYCPIEGGSRSVVGCTATAIAQLLNFWKWPVTGNDSHSYTWYGDRCGGPTVPQVLSADFSDEYDWANIVDSCDGTVPCNPDQEAALAELNYEVGVSVNMNYGSCGSAAGTSIHSLFHYFRYSPSMFPASRSSYDLDGWFSIIQNEIDNGRPLLYGIHSHSIVCDGYRDHGSGQYEYHMNYGWGQGNNAWYVFDNLHCGWIDGDICPSQQDILIGGIEPQNVPFITCTDYSLDDSAGDNDGIAEINESISLEITILNNGIDATNVEGQLTTSDPYIHISSGQTTFESPILFADSKNCQSQFTFSVDPACPDPHVALLEIITSADGGYTTTDSLQIYIGEVPGFADDMENGESLWRHSILSIGYIEEWHLEDYRAFDGSTSWKVGGDAGSDYASHQDACLMTVPFLLPENAELTFSHWIDAEIGGPGEAWDGGVIMMSLQSGQWFQIFPDGGYSHVLIDNMANPLDGGTPCYSGNQGWTSERYDLSTYSGVAQIMFRFAVDGAATEEGWYIDGVEIKSAYICGDANSDLQSNVGDAVFIINNVFKGGPLPDPIESGDANCDDNCNIGDAVYIVTNVFKGGPEPCAACK